MFKVIGISVTLLFSVAAVVLSGSRCKSSVAIPAQGSLLGVPIETTVDHPLARLIMESPLDGQVQCLFYSMKDRALNTRTLSAISKEYSMDVASLYFIQRLYQQPKNRNGQDFYTRYYHQLKSNGAIPDLELLYSYHVVFVPGLGYQSDPSTGADFARQQLLLSSAGISNELILTDEWGLVQDNAETVANRIRELSQQEQRIIVVSASKGSLETAWALARILQPEETRVIRSWISVGGILHGSPLADLHLKAPRSWVTKFLVWLNGFNLNTVRDLSYQRGNELFDQLRFPEDITILHFVGVPLSAHISKEVQRRYCQMLELGPNDGLTPLADQLTPQGITISEVGLDHYFRDAEIDRKTLALALTSVSIME